VVHDITEIYCGLGDEKKFDNGTGGKCVDMDSLIEHMKCVCRIENSQKYIRSNFVITILNTMCIAIVCYFDTSDQSYIGAQF